LPGVGVYYGIVDELGVLAGVYRGMSPPPPEQDISPELSVNYEAGARFAQSAARAELIGFYNDYSNLTDICTFSNGCLDADLDRQFEAGNARIYGLEAFFEHEVPAGPVKLPLRAVYTLTFAEFQETFESRDPLFGNVTAGDEIPYIPRHQGFVSAGIETGLAGGYVSATYVSRMRELAGDEPLDEALSTDEQFTVDLGAHFKPLGWLKLYANVRNVFDELYIVSRRPFGARPNAPRWTQVGVKADF
jgi:Fe(3+) dicitrate transport protein